MTKKEIMKYIETIPEDDEEELRKYSKPSLIEKIIELDKMIDKVYEMLDDLWEP